MKTKRRKKYKNARWIKSEEIRIKREEMGRKKSG